jgi:hypothetical protein
MARGKGLRDAPNVHAERVRRGVLFCKKLECLRGARERSARSVARLVTHERRGNGVFVHRRCPRGVRACGHALPGDDVCGDAHGCRQRSQQAVRDVLGTDGLRKTEMCCFKARPKRLGAHMRALLLKRERRCALRSAQRCAGRLKRPRSQLEPVIPCMCGCACVCICICICVCVSFTCVWGCRGHGTVCFQVPVSQGALKPARVLARNGDSHPSG